MATGKRSKSREAAVKALYAYDINSGIAGNSKSSEQLTTDIISYYEDSDEEIDYGQLDEGFLHNLVKGVCHKIESLDEYIAKHLNKGWSTNRLGPVLRAILRAAIFELMTDEKIPLKVIIDEYVGISNAFFDAKEIGFVNGILDKIAHEVRGD